MSLTELYDSKNNYQVDLVHELMTKGDKYMPPEYDRDPVYTELEKKKKFQEINTYNNIGGLRPFFQEETYQTENMRLNNDIAYEMEDDNRRKKYYIGIQKEQLKNRYDIDTRLKNDHVKSIEKTLNFKQRPTNYQDDFRYTEERKKLTNNPDSEHHSKYSFMKEYTDCKIRDGIIFRKDPKGFRNLYLKDYYD